jgi:hypothetical protein
MHEMPEVYDDYDYLKSQLESSDEVIIIVTPKVAQWLVDESYVDNLYLGEAVKVSRWEEEVRVIPVKWEEMPENEEWDWTEIGEPYIRNLESDGLP